MRYRTTGFLVLLVALGAVGNAPASPETHGVAAASVRPNPIASGVRFEANAGQFPDEVRYVARAGASSLFLTADGAVAVGAGAVVRTRFAGASSATRFAGEGRLAGVSNYFLGDDPARWRTGIEAFGRVRCSNLYDGIDLVYYGRGGRVEYDFVLAPGADPSAIRMTFEGAESVDIDGGGALVLHGARGDLRHEAPVLYQPRGDTLRSVAGRFVLRGANEVGFDVGAYDRALPLVVDPVLTFGAIVGGSGQDSPRAIAVSGTSVYVAGYTTSVDFPTVDPIGTDDTGLDVFVMRLDAGSTEPVFSTYIGGSGADVGIAMAADPSGGVFVSGYTNSTDFPVVAPVEPEGQAFDAFVVKLNSEGSELLFSSYFGGGADDFGYGIATDGAGNAYLSGTTSSADLPTANSIQGPAGGADVFVAKIDTVESRLVYATYLGGEGDDAGLGGIAVDAQGSAYVTGRTTSIHFPVVDPIKAYFGIGYDIFVTKIAPSGGAIVYSTYLGGEFDDAGLAIAVDREGSAYVAGSTGSLTFPKLTTPRHGLESDAYVVKLTPAGTAVAYSFAIRTLIEEVAQGIAVDSTGRACIVGYCTSPEFPTKNPVQVPVSTGQDAFLAMVDATGSSLVYATRLGGRIQDAATAVALDSDGTAFVTGTTASVDFPVAGAPVTSLRGGENAFVVKVSDADGPTPPSVSRVQAKGAAAKFKLTVKGSGFKAGALVFVGDDTTPWPSAKVKAAKIKLTGGESLSVKFPEGEPVRIRIVNPDGGMAFGSLVR